MPEHVVISTSTCILRFYVHLAKSGKAGSYVRIKLHLWLGPFQNSNLKYVEAYTHQAVEFIKGGNFSLGESQLLQLYKY